MAKRKGQKDKQHNDQKKRTEGQATQWPKEKDRRTSNTMTKKRERRTRNTMAKRTETEGQET
jgi:hypothetical protein